MDTLHTVLRNIRGESAPRRDHLTVFREFLDQLERAGRRRALSTSQKRAKPNGRRGRSDGQAGAK